MSAMFDDVLDGEYTGNIPWHPLGLLGRPAAHPLSEVTNILYPLALVILLLVRIG